MKPIIRVNDVSKQYRVGARRAPYATLRESLAGAARAPLRRLRGGGGQAERTVWALDGVSFEVAPGEVVGVIGRNGAGKSTLLKILSRITEPTRGRVELYGRVGSLLEVGTGFHQELTGRENIYLNGAILGMRRSEIERRFDEIVSFAEVEEFLDTPVKHYSSGMYMRLAFAVAAHLEPEILIVDEVLAVGDAAFQKKCLGKMGDVARGGRTVLFVSHNMPSVVRLCHQVMWLDQGRVKLTGPAPAVISAYLSDGTCAMGQQIWGDGDDAPGNDKIMLRAVRLRDMEGSVTSTIDIQRPFNVEIEYQTFTELPSLRVAFTLSTSEGVEVFTSADMSSTDWAEGGRPIGKYISKCIIPGDLLNSGNYILRVGADIPFKEVLFIYDNALTFNVEETGGVAGRFPEKWAGVICPRLQWSVDRVIRKTT